MNEQTQAMFVATRQHKRFVEFCEACRINRYIGVCIGRSDVGKTSSARAYANWNMIEPLIENPRHYIRPPEQLRNCSAAIWTPDVSITVKRMQTALQILRNRFDCLVEQSSHWYGSELSQQPPRNHFLELLIIDKAQRLTSVCLDAVRDFAQRNKIGVVLLGLPGFDRRLRRYDHIYNHIGFFHLFKRPRAEELRAIIELQWHPKSVQIEAGAISLIENLTDANLQKFTNIFTEIERVRGISAVTIITQDLVQLANRTLLLGTADGKG